MSMPAREDPLADVPVFSDLSPAARATLTGSLNQVPVDAGDALFHQGDAADAMYIVDSGALEVVDANTGAQMRLLSRGDVVGELALLTGELRSATVRARRDSVVLRLSRTPFEEALQTEPALASGLLAALGRQLRDSRGIEATIPDPSPVTIALLGAAGAPLLDIAARLHDELAKLGPTARMDRETTATTEQATMLDRLERNHERVLLVTSLDDDAWAAFCVRQADRTVVITGDDASPPPAGLPVGVRGGYLLTGGRSPSATELDQWRTTLAPDAVCAGGSGPADRVAPLARRLSGTSVGVVLSGGGARGFAHIGALQALIEGGVQIDRIGGCSMGSLVGALFATGRSPDEIASACRRAFVDHNPMRDYTVPLVSVMRGQKVRDMLLNLFGDRRIETLERDYFCVSADLVNSELFVHRTGPLYRAIGASICLPGLGPPIVEDGRLLVDGGVLNNLPVQPMAATGEGPVIAVDVSAPFEPPAPRGGGRPRLRSARARARALMVGDAAGDHTRLPSLAETMIRTVTLGSINPELAAGAADLAIRPDVQSIGLLEMHRLDEARERGHAAAEAALSR